MYRIHNDTMKAGELAWKQHLEQASSASNPITAVPLTVVHTPTRRQPMEVPSP